MLMRRRQKSTIVAVFKNYQRECLYLAFVAHLDFGLPFSFTGGGEPCGVSVSVPVPGPLSDCLISQSNPSRWSCSERRTFFDCSG